MPNQIRYDEAAITEIFRQAAEAQTEAQNKADSTNGLTLEELQEIGATAGLSPEFVTRAAANMARQVEEPEAPTFAGIQIGVRRSVALPGPISEEDWALLVSDLRTTFSARGKIQQAGELRDWHNGNLYANVQPDGDGYRLSMGSLKGSTREFVASGLGLSVMALVGALVVLGTGVDWSGMIALLFVFGTAVALAGIPLLQLPSWRATREDQMEAIGRRTVARMEEPAARTAASNRAVEASARLDLAESGGFAPGAETSAGADRERA
ncbi:MAG: hypothetical protein ACI9W4_001697 [Rhodothermales bacterium]|jgi:hypothetical protein